jgi:hypothetical protein
MALEKSDHLTIGGLGSGARGGRPRGLDSFNRVLAVNETLVYLDVLVLQGRLKVIVLSDESDRFYPS